MLRGPPGRQEVLSFWVCLSKKRASPWSSPGHGRKKHCCWWNENRKTTTTNNNNKPFILKARTENSLTSNSSPHDWERRRIREQRSSSKPRDRNWGRIEPQRILPAYYQEWATKDLDNRPQGTSLIFLLSRLKWAQHQNSSHDLAWLKHYKTQTLVASCCHFLSKKCAPPLLNKASPSTEICLHLSLFVFPFLCFQATLK